MECPNCKTDNPGPGPFCINCGHRLTAGAEGQSSSELLQSGLSQVGKASAAAVRDLGQSTQDLTRKLGSSVSTSSGASLWGPFAGFGKRGRHVAWLLDDAGDKVMTLHEIIGTRFARRDIPGATYTDKVLQLKGVSPDPRQYFVLQRGRATAALHLSQQGKDLFVSQVSYLLGPISKLRAWVFVGAVIFLALYLPIVMGGLAALMGNGSSAVLGWICCGGPLAFIGLIWVTIVFALAMRGFMADKDIMAPFRVTSNEFDVDDMIFLEKAVEQTVRESLDEVNVDRTLMPVASDYGMRSSLSL